MNAEPIFDSVESAVVSTIRSVSAGTYGGTEYSRLVPYDVAAEAWEFYACDERWGMDWDEAVEAAKDAKRVGTDRYGGKDRIGALA